MKRQILHTHARARVSVERLHVEAAAANSQHAPPDGHPEVLQPDTLFIISGI